MKRLSVVLPSYNEEEMLRVTSQTLAALLREEKIEYELIFVDDGSKDQTWSRILEEAANDPQIHGIRFSRNFGKEAAIFAGLAESTGDCVAVMDCDLQHPPQTLVEMYRLWEEGFEVVEAVKRSRGKESRLHRFSADAFYKIISDTSGIDMSRASDFKLMDRKAVDVLLQMKEKNAFFRALSSWIGFTQTSVEFDVEERKAGKSKWSTSALARYAVSNITGFTSLPLHFVTGAGVIVLILAIIMGIQTMVRYATGDAVEGFTTVILLLLFIGSMIMISLGIIGYYLAKIYQEIQGRPRYIVSTKV